MSMEKALEKKFCDWVKIQGGIAIKGPAPMYKGIPDRIVVLPHGGGTVWVEFKGGTYYQLTPMQLHWRKMLIDSNPDRYFLVDNESDLAHVIEVCKTFMELGNIPLDTSSKDVL